MVQSYEGFVLVTSETEKQLLKRWSRPEEVEQGKELLKGVVEKGTVEDHHLPTVQQALVSKARQMSEDGFVRAQMLVNEVDLVIGRLEVFLPGDIRKEGYVKIDGEKLRGVQRLVIEAEACKLPKVTLELYPKVGDE